MAGTNHIWICKKCKWIYWKELASCEDCGNPLYAVDIKLKDIFLSSGYTGKDVDMSAMGEFLDELLAQEEDARRWEERRKKAQESAQTTRQQILNQEKIPAREEVQKSAERVVQEQEERRKRQEREALEREERRRLEEQKAREPGAHHAGTRSPRLGRRCLVLSADQEEKEGNDISRSGCGLFRG